MIPLICWWVVKNQTMYVRYRISERNTTLLFALQTLMVRKQCV